MEELMETTLNIHKNVLAKVTEAAALQGISCSAMIRLLIHRLMDDNMDPIVIGRLIRYQKRCELGEWRTFHIQFREDEYEYFIDLRKILKMSVSLILACAVKKYLKNKNIQETDNNLYIHKNYVAIREFIGNIQCIKLFWGYPLLIEQHIPY